MELEKKIVVFNDKSKFVVISRNIYEHPIEDFDKYADDFYKCERLTFLNCTSHKNFKILKYFPNVTELSLKNSRISEMTGIGCLKGLKRLYLKQNRISEITELNQLVELEELDISHNFNINRISGLDNQKKLEYLDLGCNNIAEISGLDNLRSLKVLNLNNNHIKKIEGLENLALLEELNLECNSIRKIEGINSLNNLKELYLGYNKISEMEGLYPLRNVTTLHLESNNITEIKDITSFTKLEVFQIEGNAIEKISGLNKIIIDNTRYDPNDKIRELSRDDLKIEKIYTLNNVEYMITDEGIVQLKKPIQ